MSVGPIDARVWALELHCLARALGQDPGDQVREVVDALLARIVAGDDPRVVFPKMPHRQRTQSPELDPPELAGVEFRSIGAIPDARRKSVQEQWRDQHLAAEVLRLVKLEHCPSEALAKDAVAGAFEVDLKRVERALKEYRAELNAGALDRYIFRLQDLGASD